MAKQAVKPECKYGHGLMTVIRGELPRDQTPAVFSANAVVDNQIILGRGFLFHVYECPTCSYLEFHDYEPPK